MTRRDNIEDALQKLQQALDGAWESIQPIEEDPAKKKKLEKQCVLMGAQGVGVPCICLYPTARLPAIPFSSRMSTHCFKSPSPLPPGSSVAMRAG